MSLYGFLRGILLVIFRIIFRIEVTGIENIPIEGKIIVCSNHVSMLDPITVATSIPRRIYFMAKKELFEKKFFGSLLEKLGAFPVDRDGADLAAIRNSLKILKCENILGIFPEGTRNKMEDVDSAKPGIAMISIKGKAPIIPIYIDTQYKLFRKIRVIIGKQIITEEYYDQKLNMDDYREISRQVMTTIYNLKNCKDKQEE
ncbi:lysophospholipid acyltransferase family protein [Proteiniborus sp. MB09-C3]|uniref:lysophospholipid acyltransferase family protein n=1 Tax=Proteiniborus sp. MB09-C3 TaxID=3050072 RepID=UPI0025526280|nr:lysophospholipid acyltransferase family protein [Proteiniborus sp. MB09-C3]WIV10950.1 lysophospholipid acyltransferase family protein [Proteiniborus sp. MB09-C3]